MNRESEVDRKIRLLTLKENHVKPKRFHFPSTRKAKAEWLSGAFLICVLIASVSVYALSPTSSATASNLVMLNGSNTLQSYDGTINIGLGNLGNVAYIGLTNNQVLGWNATSSLWQNMNVSSLQNSYSMENLTDANYVGLTNGDIAMWNSTTSQWYNAHPFTTGWNTTVNQLISLSSILTSQVTGLNATIDARIASASILWSQITSANTTVNSLIQTYLATNQPYNPNYGVGSYSYLISTFTNATNTYYQAMNGTSNQIVNSWTSTNALSVLQSANNALASVGGTIYVQTGNYTLTGTFIFGSANPVRYALICAANVWFIRNTSYSGSVINTYMGNSGTYSNGYFTIENLNIDGQASPTGTTTMDGIDWCAYRSYIENTYIFNCNGSGIYVFGNYYNGVAYTSGDNTFVNVQCQNCTSGFRMGNYGTDDQISTSRFRENMVGVLMGSGDLFLQSSSIYMNTKYGLEVASNMWLECQGNWFGENNLADIAIWQLAANNWTEGQLITGNSFSGDSRAVKGTYPAIEISGYNSTYPVSDVSITANNFYALDQSYSNIIQFDANVINSVITGNTISQGFSNYTGVPFYQGAGCYNNTCLGLENPGFPKAIFTTGSICLTTTYVSSTTTTWTPIYTNYIWNESLYPNVSAIYFGVGHVSLPGNGGTVALYDLTHGVAVTGTNDTSSGDWLSGNILANMPTYAVIDPCACVVTAAQTISYYQTYLIIVQSA